MRGEGIYLRGGELDVEVALFDYCCLIFFVVALGNCVEGSVSGNVLTTTLSKGSFDSAFSFFQKESDCLLSY